MILYVFAHQDDELAAAHSIRARGDAVCAYLTDGAARVPAARRNAESLATLAELGVPPERVAFLAAAPDGRLVEGLDAALAALETRFGALPVTQVGLLAWEGGHPDHDAAHLVGLAFAQRHGVEAFEHPLYSGEGGAPFRVLTPVGDGWTRERVGRWEALKILALVRHYRSQWRTWLGLLPEGFVRLFLLGRTHVRVAKATRLFAAPHRGRLLYERRFHVSYLAFLATAGSFRDRHFRR